MYKKCFSIVFILLIFISCISLTYACDNNTTETDSHMLVPDDDSSDLEQPLENVENDNNTVELENDDRGNDTLTLENKNTLTASKKNTYIDAPNEVTYDVIGKTFEVTLLTQDNKPISDAKITISLDGNTHELKTDSNGKTSLKIRLNDGHYKITTKFQGNSLYNSCSKQTSLYINNTRVVEKDLNSQEIQKIIDNAKTNNVILFKGDLYETVNLVINKRLTLIGNGNTILKSNLKETIIEIKGKTGSLSSISGFNIQSNGDGIIIDNSDYVTIKNNAITTNGTGIIAKNVKYLEIDNNTLDKNKENGIVLAFADDCNIINNKITSNSQNGIGLAKSNNIYIYYNTINKNCENGIFTSNIIDGANYGDSPSNLHIGNNEINSNTQSGICLEKMGKYLVITSNTINGNYNDGIAINEASNNVNITYNTINYNIGNGISVSHIKNNNIYYNLIYSNSFAGIKFNYEYSLPSNQDIRFNVILANPQNEVDASETSYDHTIKQLTIGENWYGGILHICPKIKTNNIDLEIKQVDVYLFNMTFYDNDNNIVSQLPPRTVSHKVNNGRSKSFVLYNGTGTFERDASEDDIIYVTVDMGTYSIIYKSDDPSFLHLEYPPYSPHVRPIEDVGKPYPNLPRPGLLEDISDSNKPQKEDTYNNKTDYGDGEDGNNNPQTEDNTPSGGTPGRNGINGNGNGGTSNDNGFNGNGNGMNNKAGSTNGNTDKQTAEGNGTAVQSSSSNSNPSNNIGQNPNAPTSGTGSSSGPQSVVKKIIIDEENIIRVTGLSLIILLILLTIGFYYREEIKEMKSKI